MAVRRLHNNTLGFTAPSQLRTAINSFWPRAERRVDNPDLSRLISETYQQASAVHQVLGR